MRPPTDRILKLGVIQATSIMKTLHIDNRQLGALGLVNAALEQLQSEGFPIKAEDRAAFAARVRTH